MIGRTVVNEFSIENYLTSIRTVGDESPGENVLHSSVKLPDAVDDHSGAVGHSADQDILKG